MNRSTVIFPESFLMKIKGFQQAASDLSPIMPSLEEIAWRDNEEGLLRGTDKDGRPLAPLAESTLANLKRGSGGPLIPRYGSSRAIDHYRVTSIRRGMNWTIIGAWQNVLAKSGTPFLGFHFEGRGRLPQRDLRGVRPDGRQKMQEALSNWLLAKLRGTS